MNPSQITIMDCYNYAAQGIEVNIIAGKVVIRDGVPVQKNGGE